MRVLLTSNVPVQRAGRDNWVLALYPFRVRSNALLAVATANSFDIMAVVINDEGRVVRRIVGSAYSRGAVRLRPGIRSHLKELINCAS
jgi:hypothetical protein